MDKSLGDSGSLELLGWGGTQCWVNNQLKYNSNDFPRQKKVLHSICSVTDGYGESKP